MASTFFCLCMVFSMFIIDGTECELIFDEPLFEASVMENTVPAEPIITVHASDDEGNGAVTYRISESKQHDVSSLLSIDAETGDIWLIYPLDYERLSMLQFTVEASNQGEITDYASVVIRIGNANDNSPDIIVHTFSQDGIARISENAELNYFVAYITVDDIDSGVNCELDNEDHFRLNMLFPNEYTIMTASVFDFEVRLQYDVVMVCKDDGLPPLTTSVTIPILVTDVNDHKPDITVDTLTQDGRARVTENTEPNTIVAEVSVQDKDTGPGGLVSCRLYIEDNFQMFQLSETDHEIRTVSGMDYEKRPQYDLLIMCQDDGQPHQLTSSVMITVLVEDVNDNSPTFSHGAYAAALLEGNIPPTLLLQVVAHDRDAGDNGHITYSLAADAGDDFEVDSAGLIYATTTVVYDKDAPRRLFHVIASDHGLVSHTATVLVFVEIVAVDENRPV